SEPVEDAEEVAPTHVDHHDVLDGLGHFLVVNLASLLAGAVLVADDLALHCGATEVFRAITDDFLTDTGERPHPSTGLANLVAVHQEVADVAVVVQAREGFITTADRPHALGPLVTLVSLRRVLGRNHLVLLNGDPLISGGNETEDDRLSVLQLEEVGASELCALRCLGGCRGTLTE